MLSIIVPLKNEAAMLPRTLPAVLAFADEVILCDHGSTDETREVVLDLLGPVLSWPRAPEPGGLEWNQRTSYHPGKASVITLARAHPSLYQHEMRNAAASLAESPWVLWVDADELVSGDPVRLHSQLLLVEYVAAGLPPGLHVMLRGGDVDLWRGRLFRWPDGWAFRYCVDCQLAPPSGHNGDGSPVPHDLLLLEHLRSSSRPGSLERKEHVLQSYLMSRGGLPPAELEHYQESLDYIETRSPQC